MPRCGCEGTLSSERRGAGQGCVRASELRTLSSSASGSMLVAVVVVVVVAERWLCGRRELNQPACLPAYSLAHSLTHALTARLAPLRCTPSSRASERRRVRASNARRQSSCEVPSTHKTNACAHDEQREEDERYAPRSRSLSSVACGAVRGGQQQRRRAARRGATRERERGRRRV